MAQFIVVGKDRATGKSKRANIEARDEQHARERATRHGIDVQSITSAPSSVAVATPAVSVIGQSAPLVRRAGVPMAAAMEMPPMPTVAQPVYQQIHMHTPPQVYGAPAAPRGVSGFGIAALVLGILACLICWVPLFGLVSIPIAGLGLLLAFVGFIVSLSGRRSGVGMPIAGGFACGLAIAVSLLITIGPLAAVAGVQANRIANEVKENEAAAAANAGKPPLTMSGVVQAIPSSALPLSTSHYISSEDVTAIENETKKLVGRTLTDRVVEGFRNVDRSYSDPSKYDVKVFSEDRSFSSGGITFTVGCVYNAQTGLARDAADAASKMKGPPANISRTISGMSVRGGLDGKVDLLIDLD